MAGIGFDSRKIEENGWKQGACLLVDEFTVVHTVTQCMQEKLPVGLYVVLSQDCDVLNHSLEREPVIELIFAKKLEYVVGNLVSGKNVRELHLELKEYEVFLEIKPNNRFFIDRLYLQKLIPAQFKVTDRSLKILISWIKKRYSRSGWYLKNLL